MTEKEAIEILKYMNDGYTFQDCRVCASNNKFNEKKGICESKTCEYLNAIETVIQALEQKDKEIQELKEKWNKDTHTLQNQLDIANADIVEKDKIIKAMAKYINSTDKDEDVCRETGDTFNCTEYRNCEECIINFFKKKVSEEKIK